MKTTYEQIERSILFHKKHLKTSEKKLINAIYTHDDFAITLSNKYVFTHNVVLDELKSLRATYCEIKNINTFGLQDIKLNSSDITGFAECVDLRYMGATYDCDIFFSVDFRFIEEDIEFSNFFITNIQLEDSELNDESSLDCVGQIIKERILELLYEVYKYDMYEKSL